MDTLASVIFPYTVPRNDESVFERLLQVLDTAVDGDELHTSREKPLLVVNWDTIRRDIYTDFQNFLKRRDSRKLLDDLDVVRVWSVDTCQMWLAGYGRILEKLDNHRHAAVLQIPGDLKHVQDFGDFTRSLGAVKNAVAADDKDLSIGDFEVDRFGAKHLIDQYGVYPLLYNWFPEVAKKYLRDDKLRRPRSEFLCANLRFLDAMLRQRKFAYEQTLAFLVHAHHDEQEAWRIGYLPLGKLEDYQGWRGFREANDQIERTERMLKLLWREKNGGDNFDVKKFERLDRRSTAIREAAIVSLENVLRPEY